MAGNGLLLRDQLEGDDEELVRLGHEHADAHDPADGITDEFVRGNVAQFARDSVDA